jgi:putative ABC transport system substrate-binding protein
VIPLGIADFGFIERKRMNENFWLQVLNAYSANRKHVLSPSTPLRINSVEGSKTCPESRRRIQNQKWVGIVAIGISFAMCGVVAQAQQQKKIPKLGWLGARPASIATGRKLLERELRTIGYIDGKNVTFESRYAEGKYDRLVDLADELVRLNVDVFVTPSDIEALAAKNATRSIPIVFLEVSDPVTDGLVESLARPGGNLTGFTSVAPVLAGKRLELLKETIPNLVRVAVLWNPRNPGSEQQWKESQLPARGFGLQLHSMEVSSADKYESAFKEAIKARSTALAVTLDSLANFNAKRIADLAARDRLPTIYPREAYVLTGGLMSYGPDRAWAFKRAATYVDKILKGAKPADLPVEQPTKFEFVINLKAAKQIGVTIPPNVLARADKVIR